MLLDLLTLFHPKNQYSLRLNFVMEEISKNILKKIKS